MNKKNRVFYLRSVPQLEQDFFAKRLDPFLKRFSPEFKGFYPNNKQDILWTAHNLNDLLRGQVEIHINEVQATWNSKTYPDIETDASIIHDAAERIERSQSITYAEAHFLLDVSLELLHSYAEHPLELIKSLSKSGDNLLIARSPFVEAACIRAFNDLERKKLPYSLESIGGALFTPLEGFVVNFGPRGGFKGLEVIRY